MEPSPLLNLSVTEYRPGLGRYARTSGALGARVSALDPGPDADAALSKQKPPGRPDLLVCSFVPFSLSPEQLACGAFRARAKALWADCLTQEPLRQLARLLHEKGWKTCVQQCSGRTLEDQQWWRRWVLCGTEGDDTTGPLKFLFGSALDEPATPAGVYNPRWLKTSAGGWRYKGLRLDSAMPYLGATTPKPAGVRTTEDGKRQLLWDPKRPLPALHSKSWITEGQVPQNDSLWLLLEGFEGTGARPLAAQEACGLLGLGLTGPLPGRDWDETARAGLKEPPLTLAEAATVWAAKVLTTPGTSLQPVESVKAGVCTLAWDAHTRERFLGWVDQRRADRAEGEPTQAVARSAPGSGRGPPESTRGPTPASGSTLGPSTKQAELEASKLMSSWADSSSHQWTPDRHAGGPPKGKGSKAPKGKGGKRGKSKDKRLAVDKALSRLLRHEAGTRDIPITADGCPRQGRSEVRAVARAGG